MDIYVKWIKGYGSREKGDIPLGQGGGRWLSRKAWLGIGELLQCTAICRGSQPFTAVLPTVKGTDAG